jgi:hypothetical protein
MTETTITTIEELINEPGWYHLNHEAVWTLPGGADLVVDGTVVAITDEYDRAIYRVAHPTEAAAVRAALQIVAALDTRWSLCNPGVNLV